MTALATTMPAAIGPDAMLPRPARVLRYQRETHDTFTLELGLADEALPFEPGQFNMLYLPGVGEVPISISGDPSRPECIVHTTREVGAVTRAIRGLKPGDELGLRGPYGTAWPVEVCRNRDVILVAGGIGLAPLRPVMYWLLDHRQDLGRVVLLHGARTPRDILYRHQLRSWRGRMDLDVHVTVDRVTGNWRGNVGVITSLVPKAPLDAEQAVAFICGPEIMIKFAAEALMQRGLTADRIYCSLERNMKCAVGLCGHCQFGPLLVCRDGPVCRYDAVDSLLNTREI